MRILADASLPNITKCLHGFFDLLLFDNHASLLANIDSADILVCRSTVRVDEDLLKSSKIKCVATASSGTDHIDKKYLTAKNINIIDAKGINAQAVCDYVLASLVWLNSNHSFLGKNVGIVGVGEVGTKLWKILQCFGFAVKGYDPLKAQRDVNFNSCSLKDLCSVDIICIHADLHANYPYPSLNLFNAQLLKQLKPGVIVINAARGGIVNEDDLLAMNNKIIYCTDVFLTEPNINQDIVEYATLSTPHIAGHSIEAKENAVYKIFQELYKLYAPNIVDKWGNQEIAPFPNHTAEANYFVDSVLDLAKQKNILALQDLELQTYILNQYNPYFETEAMKLAKDKSHAFIQLRKSHTFRHDFLWFIT